MSERSTGPLDAEEWRAWERWRAEGGTLPRPLTAEERAAITERIRADRIARQGRPPLDVLPPALRTAHEWCPECGMFHAEGRHEPPKPLR